MVTRLSIAVGTMLSVVLMVLALFVWQKAGHWAFDAPRQDLAAWGIRAGALALAALAQTVILLLVIGNIFRTRRSDLILRFSTGAVFAMALIGAMVLGWAGTRG